MVELKSIKGDNKPNEFQEALRNMKDLMSDTIEFLVIDAQLKKAKYDALRNEGFQPHQALELCKGPVIQV